MRFSEFTRAVTAFAAASAIAGGVAFAKSTAAAAHDVMMRADGTMVMSGAAIGAMHDATAAAATACPPASGSDGRCFKVQIDNVSTADAFTASNGVKWTLPFSPGVFALSAAGNPMFAAGSRDRGEGLRALAEDGDPLTLAANVKRADPDSGTFLVPVGGSKPKGITPGQSFVFYTRAKPSQRLYFVCMFGQSNDWFYGTPGGIALFGADGAAASGDVTASVALLDAGTEADQELGIGSTQGPRQPHPRFGPPDADPTLRLATSDKRFTDVSKVMRVTVTAQ